MKDGVVEPPTDRFAGRLFEQVGAHHGSAGGLLAKVEQQPCSAATALLEPQDLQALLAAWRARPAGVELVLPQHAGQPGHPIVFGPLLRRAVRIMARLKLIDFESRSNRRAGQNPEIS